MKYCRLFLVLLTALLPVGALAAPSLMGGKKGNDKPIEILSDQLEVQQDKNRAIFTGNVIASQGTMRLKADRMTVYYKSGGSAAPGGSDSISRIEVDGHVFLTTPKETASGVKGVYDVPAKEIRLQNNVVLTQDKNVLKGDALTYNFTTGQSKVTSGGKGVSGSTDGDKPGRVRALFVPEKKKEPTP